MRYLWASATDVGLVRQGNEDAVYPTDPGSVDGLFLAAVADGMGGHVGGEIASRLAMEAAVKTGGEAAVRLQAANRAVVDAIEDDTSLTGMGTTLTLGLFGEDGHLKLGHVGDSRAYLLRDLVLRQITKDHTLVAELVAAGRIRPEDADSHPQKNLVTRAIGIADEIEVDELEEKLQAGDRVLFCSDGLTNMLTNDEVADLLCSLATPEEAVWGLIDAANKAGGVDNITVVVVDVLE